MSNPVIEFKSTLRTALPRIAYLHVGFADSICAKSSAEIESDAGFVLDVSESWPDLINAIVNSTPRAVLVHLHALRNGPGSVSEISTMLQAVLSLCPLSSTNRIGIVVDSKVDMEVVKELRKNNILNIVPGVEFLGQEESTKATIALLAGEPYIPPDAAPEPNLLLPRVVSFWSKPVPQLSVEIKQQIIDKKLYTTTFCDTWDSLADAVEEHPDLVVFHCKMRNAPGNLMLSEIVDMIAGLVRYTSGTPPKIAAVIDRDTPLEIIKELQKTSVSGIVPSSAYWGVDIATTAVTTLLNSGAYWPKDIIASLPGNIVKHTPSKNKLQLTTRQKQIVDLICTRGLSNKRIASTLHIAESTVKIHVSAVLKVYGVRTRTQLALVGNK
jgi:DNA-binding NarL/FixJ family response regulator